jgi:serine protease Do
VGNGNGTSIGLGSAVVIRPDGVLLTAFHVVKDAREVQIKFKNGDVYDDVQLLGVDQRRDVAALRVSAGRLPTLSLGSPRKVKPGIPVYTVSQARALPCTASSGIVSAVRLADEVEGAGNGYRLIQFTASISPGSSGGLLVDGNARLLGIIVGTFKGGQNLNFAVPVESVLGLADVPATTTFRSGTRLQLPTPVPVLAHKPQAGVDIEGPEKSELIASRDPKFILRKFRTL